MRDKRITCEIVVAGSAYLTDILFILSVFRYYPKDAKVNFGFYVSVYTQDFECVRCQHSAVCSFTG